MLCIEVDEAEQKDITVAFKDGKLKITIEDHQKKATVPEIFSEDDLPFGRSSSGNYKS